MKKGITIGVIVLVCIGFGYFLFSISPKQSSTAPTTDYNSSLDISGAKQISQPGAFDPSVDHYMGNKNAKNVFVEYGDMECPACAAYHTMLKDVATTFTDTVFVFRYFPLTQIHKNSVEAALAAEAAGAQGKYWEMHDTLFNKQTEWQDLSDPLDQFVTYAQSVGVADINQFKSDITSKKYLPKIQKDADEAIGLSLQGTPTFFFNGHMLQNQDIAGLKTQSEAFLNK